MRVSILLIASAILFVTAQCHAQQDPPPNHKAITPGQKAYQQQYQSWFARHHQLQAQAKDIFAEETSHEKAPDCPAASSNSEFIACFSELAESAEETLKSYEEAIHGLLIAPPQTRGAPIRPTPGPGGLALSTTQFMAEFDSVESTWRQYREIACAAALHQFDGGTGGPGFQAECELRLTRNHVRELDMIYGNVLHL